MAANESLTTACIEYLLVAVASPDRHEDSPERKAAWDEIKRRDGARRVVYADKRGRMPCRYVRLLTLGRFEIALTWVQRKGRPEGRPDSVAGG